MVIDLEGDSDVAVSDSFGDGFEAGSCAACCDDVRVADVMEPDLRQLVFLADGFEPMADALGVCRGAIFVDGDIPGMIAPFVALGELLCVLLRPEASQGVDRGLVEADGSGAFLGFGGCFVDGAPATTRVFLTVINRGPLGAFSIPDVASSCSSSPITYPMPVGDLEVAVTLELEWAT